MEEREPRVDNGTQRRRILLLPYFAQSHLIAFIGLAKLLERRLDPRTFMVTIVTTPLNASRLRADTTVASAIDIAELQFRPTDHGLPPGCENTNNIPAHLTHVLLQAGNTLQPVLDSLIEELRARDGGLPLCIITDPLMSWSVHTARAFGIIHAVFHTIGAFPVVISKYLFTQLPIKKHPIDHVFTVPDFSGISFDRTQIFAGIVNAKEDDPWLGSFTKTFFQSMESDIALMNTVEELEANGLDHLRRNTYKKVWAVGPLLGIPSSPKSMQVLDKNSATFTPTQNWLRLHPPSSILYVSFGSEQTLHLWQMMELAKGLEDSGKAFIWVIRPPTGIDIKSEFRPDWLPEGFEDTVGSKGSNRGLLLTGWAPQVDILSHESTGGFLTHCGWNSTMESIMNGVPIIGWPLVFDQFYNSKLVEEELEVGVEMARGKEARIDATTIAKLVNVVLDGGCGRGEEMRRKVRRLAELMREATVEEENHKGSSIRAVDDFIQILNNVKSLG